MKKKASKTIAAIALLVSAGGVLAQNGTQQPPLQNVVQLSATGTVEVVQDWLVVTLAATREGGEAAVVQTQLKQVLEAALADAKRQAQPGQVEVRTGAFSLYPRNGKDGKINGWQGRAELIVEGRDVARISALTGKVQGMAINQIGFDLSREARAKVEGEAQAKAIEQFKARATELTRSFGFAGYTLREVSVSDNETESYGQPRTRMMRVGAAAMAADAPVPVEAGKAQVVVTVSGSVQMR